MPTKLPLPITYYLKTECILIKAMATSLYMCIHFKLNNPNVKTSKCGFYTSKCRVYTSNLIKYTL